MAPVVLYPVEVLRENTNALDEARLACEKEPDSKAVHRLRTLSRRVEAQLLLLDSVPTLPKHKKEAKRLRRELKKLRRGASEVRDLDVQRKRLGDFATPGGDADADGTTGKPDDVEISLEKGIATLDAHLQEQRGKHAAKLQMMLRKHGSRISEAAKALLERVGDEHRFQLSPDELLTRAGALVAGDALLRKSLHRTLTEVELHSVRKAAKAARYLAETMPQQRAVESAGKRFEALQDAGGAWHDDLELARLAKRVVGKKHALTRRVALEQQRNLRVYREALRAEAKRSQPLAMPAGVAAA